MPVNIEKDLLRPLPPLYPLKGFLWKSEKSSNSFTDFRLRKTWSSVFFYIHSLVPSPQKSWADPTRSELTEIPSQAENDVFLRAVWLVTALSILNTQYSILMSKILCLMSYV